MAVQRTLIGNIKGPKGDKGDTGSTGARGAGATVSIGSVTTTAYGGNASVTNSGTSTDAVFDFVIPQGRPGEQVTDMQNLTLSSISQPSTQFPAPSIGDDGKTLFGKVVKWESDMAALVATKLNAANVVNNVTTTESGYALDARVGKTMNDWMRVRYDSAYEWVLPSETTGALLDTINTLRTQSKVMPFCIQKPGNASVSDLPPNITATEEFQVLVFGSSARWTAVLVRFSPQSSGAIFLRNGWRDAWQGGWGQINVSSVS